MIPAVDRDRDTEDGADSQDASPTAVTAAVSETAETIAGLSRTVRRQRVFVAVALAAALAAGGGLAASAWVKSPAEQAAQTRPPAASVLTAPVVRKVLQDSVVVRGTVHAAGGIDVSVPAAAGGSTAGAGTQLVSRVYAKAGDEVSAGQVLVEVSGSPIVALTGAVPMYRDLKPNADGDDVAQLQDALKHLGYGIGEDAKGHFGPGTKEAVSEFYQHLGYPVPTTGGPGDAGDRQALQGAADAVTAQQRQVAADEQALSKARQALKAAAAATASGGASGGGTTSGSSSVPSNSQSSASPPAIGAGAEPAADPGNPSGSPTAGSSGGTGGAGGAGGGTGGLGGDPVQNARDAVTQAQQTLGYARHDLAEAEQKQADLIASTGPMVPLGAVVFVPAFPVRVSAVKAGLGQQVSGVVLTLESGALSVSSVLQPGQNNLVKPGMKVTLTAEALGGQQAAATVAAVGALSAGGAGAAPAGASQPSASAAQPSQPGYPMQVTPNAPLPASWAGQDVRVTISNAASAGPVLTVPVSALSSGADGQASVTVVAADGVQRRVPVSAGASADGDVQVTPVDPAALKEGDTVVVGRAQP